VSGLLIRADARQIPLASESVQMVCMDLKPEYHDLAKKRTSQVQKELLEWNSQSSETTCYAS